jgi:hypothetical protein
MKGGRWAVLKVAGLAERRAAHWAGCSGHC